MSVTPVRNIFSELDALFLLRLSWKLKCIKLNQYHLDPVCCNSICLTKSLCCITYYFNYFV